MISSCTNNNITVYETSESGNNLTELSEFNHNESVFSKITINKDVKFQKITGFGGAFTESSAYNLNKLSKEKRDEVLKAYFSKEGANYSLTRTHMNSCDFSLNNYSYSPVEDDINLDYFSVEEDINDLIPMIKDAINISEDGWFGESIGPKQHFVHGIFRAIENGKYVIRSANNGMAGVINPLGEIEQKINFGEDGYIDFNKRKNVDKTIFSTIGNLIFVFLILLYIFLIFSFNRIKNE